MYVIVSEYGYVLTVLFEKYVVLNQFFCMLIGQTQRKRPCDKGVKELLTS